MSKKYYAVAVGHEIGIFEDWPTCQKHTSGFPKAKFKSFSSIEEAEKYIEENSNVQEEDIDYDFLIKECLENERVVAFTDGSYSANSPKSGFGCYIIPPNGKHVEISDLVHTDKFKDSNNIAPEVMAVIQSIKWAISNEYSKISIFYDLELLGNWAKGLNKARADIGIFFLNELAKFEGIIDIDYIWVRGHTGVEYNERADELAGQAMHSSKPVGKYGSNSFYGTGVSKAKVLEIIDIFKEVPNVNVQVRQDDSTSFRYNITRETEKLTITHYNRKGSTWLQGEVKTLFSEFLSLYTMNLSQFEMLKAYSDSYKQTLQIADLRSKIKDFNFPADYPTSAIKLVEQSLLMLQLDRIEVDYSHYTHSSYRALEGHLIYLFKSSGHHISSKDIGSLFGIDSGTGKRVIKSRAHQNITNKANIEDVYNLIYNNRHPIAHFGDIIIDNFDDTLLIPNFSEAKDRIEEVHAIIKF